MSRTSIRKTSLQLLALLLPLTILSGCGGGVDDAYSGPTGTVKGTVKLDGAALTTPASVSFVNLEKGFTATGTTDSSGAYSLTSKDSGDIPVGTYKITVIPAATGEAPSAEAAMEQSMKQQESGGTAEPATGEIPAKYAAPGTSGLTYEVKEGDQSHDIELTK